MEITEELTQKVATLARLQLTQEEVTKFTGQLKQILHYVEQLNEVNVEGVDPLTHPITLETKMRADEVRPSPVNQEGTPKVLVSAPEKLDDGFKVPPIL
ncbi:MAG: hypothetical protein A3K03_06955 [Bdellovibrionales bacterium RIFOXYD1_FULL_44_7]|nr:MAG: hypothetical protein A3K03_06955 [Bdellovibrionales bacterium RIFOXYD1_FULL_44_7]